jgi:hypothetical protein
VRSTISLTRPARARLRAVLGIAVAVASAGCNAAAPPRSGEPTASTADGSPAASIPVATEAASSAPATEKELQAIQFRLDFGLPSDLAHVRAVAADPNADTSFGVPLLPAEFMELMNRTIDAEAIIPIIRSEAAKAPQDFCGMWLDQANSGAVTSGWRANLVLHEAAVRLQLRPGARVAFVPCRWSLEDLRALQDRIVQDDDWFRERDIALRGVGASEKDNVLWIEVSSTVPNVAEIIADRYDVPVEMLQVESDGTGAAFVPWGEVRVFVTSRDGGPVGENALILLWGTDEPGLACGIMDMGFGIRSDGKPTKLPCQAGRWTISVHASLDDVYGEGTVVVKADQTVDLHIQLDRDPPPLE